MRGNGSRLSIQGGIGEVFGRGLTVDQERERPLIWLMPGAPPQEFDEVLRRVGRRLASPLRVWRGRNRFRPYREEIARGRIAP
jgi:hypothetical protein